MQQKMLPDKRSQLSKIPVTEKQCKYFIAVNNEKNSPLTDAISAKGLLLFYKNDAMKNRAVSYTTPLRKNSRTAFSFLFSIPDKKAIVKMIFIVFVTVI